MPKIKILWRLLFWSLTSGVALAQTTNLDSFKFTLTPADGKILVSESTNLVTIAIANLFSVTTVDTNQVTNIIFTNVTVGANFIWGTNTNNVSLRDSGQPPDKSAGDGIYSANLIIPYTDTATNLPVTFTLKGDDLTATNDTGQQYTATVTKIALVTYKIVPRPPNDKFTNAYKIVATGSPILATNNYASIQAGEPQHAQVATVDASVWWIWSSPSATNVLVDLAGSSFNPVLAVYTGDALTNLTEVASATNDVANNLLAHVNFDAAPGVTYHIAVAGLDSSTNSQGNLRLRVVPGGTPDTRPPLVSISSPNRQSLVTTNVLAVTGLAKEPLGNDSGISNVFVQVNSSPPTNAIGTDNWSCQLTLPPGTNVVRAYAVDYAGNVGLADAVVVRYINPTNDNFTEAILLTGVGGIVRAINGRATLEPGEPLHAGNVGGRSVWYKWRAPANGTLTLTTAGSDFDTLLDVYVGTNLTNLIVVDSNDDAYQDSKYSAIAAANVLSNQLYYVSVDGYGGASGTLQLQYAFVAPAPGQFYNLTVTATPGGAVFPPSAVYPAGARVVLTATPQDGFDFVGWDGGASGPNNPLTLTMSGDTILNATFRLKASSGSTNTVVTDDFETGDFTRLPWDTSTPGSRWLIQTNVVWTGKFAARSAPIGDGKRSSLVLQTNMAAGVASFDVRVSTEASWDFLEFFLNGKLVTRWSGEVPWTNFLYTVPAGTNRLEWRYNKDNSFSAGLDAAFIDNVFVPLATPTASTNAAAAFLILTRTPDGQAQITVQCQPNRSYQLETSSDLNYWFPLDSKDSPTGILQFLDAEAARLPARFYRAVAQ